jgi:hypothetical protein
MLRTQVRSEELQVWIALSVRKGRVRRRMSQRMLRSKVRPRGLRMRIELPV